MSEYTDAEKEYGSDEAEYGHYKPSKKYREVRRRVYERWTDMRDDPVRKLQESEWDMWDEDYQMPFPEVDSDDWRAHIKLPDAWSAIQAHMQETIERYSRPQAVATESEDEAEEKFVNSVLNFNMDRTGFDLQWFYAKLAGAIRGTSFLMDYYRLETRTVMDPVGVNEDGTLKYEEKTIVDYDDDYTEWVDNEWIYVDPAADHIDNAVDMFRREILSIENFQFKYGNRPGFFDTEFVRPGGDLSRSRIFQPPEDINADEVEILHYYNQNRDAYEVVANNVVCYCDPLPTKHKKLPLSVYYHYRVPGRFWGLGVPKIVKMLSEERTSIRNLNLDRQKMHLQKMFLHNTTFDIDEEDLEVRPSGLISVETGGLPLSNVMQPLEYGDVPASYFRTEEIMQEDIRRAHGIDDRIQGVQTGGTATEAAILKESALKRVNMISVLSELDTIKRIGRLKWSNIQFLYKAPRYDKIISGDDSGKVLRSITTNGQRFSVEKGDKGPKLKIEQIEGKAVFQITKQNARFLDGDYDFTVNGTVHVTLSKPIRQAKFNELLSGFLGNPKFAAELDARKIIKRGTSLNDEDPNDWLREAPVREEQEELARLENYTMAAGQPLAGTDGATPDHTLIHMNYMDSPEYEALPEPTKQIFLNHILQEHDNNPLTGSSADLLGGYGIGGDGASPPPGGASVSATVEGAPAPQLAAAPQQQMVDANL